MQFVTLLKFTPQGVAGVNQTTTRARQFISAAEANGVKVKELLWTQGHYDGLILFEAEDPEAAAVSMLNASSAGNVKTETMVAFDAAGMDRILNRTNS
jgi:uncharacterized protein with GYD domain